MRKAIVTGATGFIGRFMVRELIDQGVEVTAVVRPKSTKIKCLPENVKIVECELTEIRKLPDLINDKGIDCVFHTAWQGVSDSDARNQSIQMQNIIATLNLIDSMHEMGINTFVGCGSIHEVEALVEISQDKPITNMGFMYKSAKTAAHWMGKAKCGQYGISFFWPLINTYGEEEKSARLINTIIRKIYMNQSPSLSMGYQIYDFVYVSDVAHALYLIAEKGIDGTNYTIGSGDAKPLKDFLSVVGQIANEYNGNTDIPLGFGEITNNVISLPKDTFDITSLVNDTGFFPKVSFEDGVKKTADWIRRSEFSVED